MTDRSQWELREVDGWHVRPLVIEHHYLHRWPGVVPCAMALLVDEKMMGALVWALPPREQGEATWELARLWLADELPRNSESWTIGRGIAHVRGYHPEVLRLVSYADPAVGHKGTIYRATNWTYEGLTDSDRKTARFDYYVNGRRFGRASHTAGQTVTKIRRQPKHRFSMALTKTRVCV